MITWGGLTSPFIIIVMKSFLYKNFTPLSERTPDYVPCDDYSESNCIYDQNVGITHIILKDGQSPSRIVSDVELVMTSDPSITSLFSKEYLAQLKNTILSKPHNSFSNLDKDGNPLFGAVIPSSLERDELSNVIEHCQGSFHSQVLDAVLSSHESQSDQENDSQTNES